MSVNHEGGHSVYCQVPFETRQYHPLYQHVRQLIQQLSPSGDTLLDIGCGDLPLTNLLIPNYRVIGLDLSILALSEARKQQACSRLVNADIISLPIGTSPEVRGIMLLDIIEHLQQSEAQAVLRQLKEKFPNAYAIVSMPIIEPTIPLARELCIMAKGGLKRPNAGLLDRTHKILATQTQHRQMFNNCCWQVHGEWVSTAFFGIQPNRPPTTPTRLAINLCRFQGIYHLI